MSFDELFNRLRPYTVTGSLYTRAVADNLRTAGRMNRGGRHDEAEYWLAEAEESARRNGVTA